MKTINAIAIAAFVAASAGTAAFAGDAAEQTPFIIAEAHSNNTVSTAAVRGTNEYAVQQANRAGFDQDDAAAQTAFVYTASDSNDSAVTRANNNLSANVASVRGTNEFAMTHNAGHNLDQDDAAIQTPYVYTE